MPNYDVSVFVSDPYGDSSGSVKSSSSSSGSSSSGTKKKKKKPTGEKPKVTYHSTQHVEEPRQDDPPPKGRYEARDDRGREDPPKQGSEREDEPPKVNYGTYEPPKENYGTYEPPKENYGTGEGDVLEPRDDDGGDDKTSSSSTPEEVREEKKQKKLAAKAQERAKELEALETRPRQLGPFAAQVRPVCGRTGGGPQRLVARPSTWKTYELGKFYKGENILALWHTYLYEDRRRINRRWMWASLDEDTSTTVCIRYLRAHDNLGDIPEAERPLYDRDRYRIEVQGGKLHYRGKLMDTADGEVGRYIYVMSPQGELYAANVHKENVDEGIGPWLKALDAEAERIAKEGFSYRDAHREPPYHKYERRPKEPPTCALQALDRDPGCLGTIGEMDGGMYVLGVKTAQSPTGLAPTFQDVGVELFKDPPGGAEGVWVCGPCFQRRGRETRPDGSPSPKWPVIVRPAYTFGETKTWIKDMKLENEYFSVLDAMEQHQPGLKRRAIPALRSAATEALAEKAKANGDAPTRKVTLLHHSSLLAGGPVACAGAMGVKEGVLQYLDNNSGHYSPARPLLLQALARLHALGADMSKVDLYFMYHRAYTFPDDWNDLRTMIGDLDDEEAMARAYEGPGVDKLAMMRQELGEYIAKLRKAANLVALPPDAPPVPCATEGCGATSTCVAGDEVGETFLCQKCLDVRLRGRCDTGGCAEPSAHVVQNDQQGAPDLHLCQKHFQERHTIKCAETGCTKTSQDSVMDAISRSFFCKDHFAEAMKGMGLDVCEDPDCTETSEVALVGEKHLCKAHR